MPINDFYSYQKIEDAMYKGALAVLDDIENDKPNSFCDLLEFKKRIFKKMCITDEKINEIFKDRPWVKTVVIGQFPDGKDVEGVELDSYLENTYKNVADQINENDVDRSDLFDEWEAHLDGFFRALIGIDTFISAEDYENAKKKSTELIKRFATLKNVRMMKARMLTPSFDNPLDTVDWLEREIYKLEN